MYSKKLKTEFSYVELQKYWLIEIVSKMKMDKSI